MTRGGMRCLDYSPKRILKSMVILGVASRLERCFHADRFHKPFAHGFQTPANTLRLFTLLSFALKKRDEDERWPSYICGSQVTTEVFFSSLVLSFLQIWIFGSSCGEF
ncbi:hypothetical protein K1719_008485 [Acacia pycnantha]|nr:hypothetical protein K1719_008485 [Acacia pycnantha]